MTATVIVAVLAVIALAFVAAPLRRGHRDEPADDLTSELEERKHAALVGILDLEGERELGKLTEEDLHELRGHYEAEALSVLAELDAAGRTPDSLEREIAAVRRRLENPPG